MQLPKISKWLLIASAAVFVLALIYYGVEEWQRGKYNSKITALESLVHANEAKAAEVEREAETLKNALEGKYAELNKLRSRAEIAEDALRNTRRNVKPLKEAYETIRLVPVPTDPVSCADACKQLAAIGYPCK